MVELEGDLRDLGATGGTLALLVNGVPRLQVGLGELRPQPDARFYAYSVTKTLLATLTVQLASEGRLDLDGPIQSWLPDLPLRTPVTVRQLLNHTGGLPDYGGMRAYHEAVGRHPETAWPPSRYMELVSDGSLLFRPGDGWSYSNVGYMLVRRILEAVCGQPSEQSLAERIVRPLGLTETRFVSTRSGACDLAPGYGTLDERTGRENVVARYDPGWVAHGVVRSTALDLARVLDALLGGGLVSSAHLAEMRAAVPVPGAFPPGLSPGYGLGLMVQTTSIGRVVGHNGGGPGYSVACWGREVEGDRLVGACMVNEDLPNAAQTLLFRAFERVLDERQPRP